MYPQFFRACVLATGLAMCTPAIAQETETPRVSNAFFQSDLRQALEDLSAQTGVNIIVDPLVQGIVTVTIDDKPLNEALDLLLAGTGYRVVRRDDFFLVYSPGTETELQAEVSQTRIVQLVHVDPETAQQLLAPALQRYVRLDAGRDRIAVIAPPEILTRIISDLAAIDVPGEETVFIALNHISAANARSLLPDRLQRHVRIDEERNSVSVTGASATRDEVTGLLRRLDQPLPPANVDSRDIYPTRIVKLDHATAEVAMNLLPEAVLQYVRADLESNTLSVSAPPNVGNKILHDIARIDMPRTHVILEARVVVLERNDLLDFGNDFQWPEVLAGFSNSDAGSLREVRVGYSPSREFTNALSLTLNLLSSNDEATIVSNPQVLARDGLQSEIRVTTEEYFQIVTENDAVVRSDLEQIETGTVLRITPQIGRSGTITLLMELEVSDVIARGQQNLPVVNRRTAQSAVQIEDGGTAAIAGLIDTRSQVNRQGLPGTINIPVLGRLLRSDRLDHQAQQIAIFVTAHIVEGEDSRFRTGRDKPPNLGTVDEEAFRVELGQALYRLGVLQ